MSGLIGILGHSNVASQLVKALTQMEYRGYDRAGIAIIGQEGIGLRRSASNLDMLERDVVQDRLIGRLGIGHTRRTKDGPVTPANAHPHRAGRVTLVHNGMIENHAALRKKLVQEGHRFTSETDSEVIAACLNQLLRRHENVETAMTTLLSMLDGHFALAIMLDDDPDMLLAVRQGSPLVLGYGACNDVGEVEMIVASDTQALLPFARSMLYLKDGEWVIMRRDSVQIFDTVGVPMCRSGEPVITPASGDQKNGWPHHLRKEIDEQTQTLSALVDRLVNNEARGLRPFLRTIDFESVDRIILVACGASLNACSLASYWIEHLAGLPVEVINGGKHRYRKRRFSGREAVIVVNPSDETEETLAALSVFRDHVAIRIAVLNTRSSAVVREADAVLDIKVGPEIGFVSTKSFTGLALALLGIALKAAKQRGTLLPGQMVAMIAELQSIPYVVTDTLGHSSEIETLAWHISRAKRIYILGRDLNTALAAETARIIRELVGISAEHFGSGKVKDGPTEMINEGTPVLVFENLCNQKSKIEANISEIEALGAQVIRFGPGALCDIRIEAAGPLAICFSYAIIAQLLTYELALDHGLNVDKLQSSLKAMPLQ